MQAALGLGPVERQTLEGNDRRLPLADEASKGAESDKAEMALAKINSEMEILKKDLEKNVDEIIQNCYNDKIEDG